MHCNLLIDGKESATGELATPYKGVESANKFLRKGRASDLDS
jgi:hypothetical protein